MEVVFYGYRMLVPDDTTGEDKEIALRLLEAYAKYRERNGQRKGVWRRSGLKGQCEEIFAKAERAFTMVFRNEIPDPDEFRDLINYAAFAWTLVIDRNRFQFEGSSDTEILNGSWPWEG